jgi:mono/diheme cytochrome c family protein
MSHAHRLAAPFLVAALAFATACREAQQAAPSPAAPAAAAAASVETAAAHKAAVTAEAKQLFAERCANCHGVNGAANGPGSKELDPRPRNFQDPGWQTSVTDAYIEQIVFQGGAAVGKSAVMPAQPDLADKPEVVTALCEYIRTFH